MLCVTIWGDTLGCECLLEITQPFLRDASKLLVRLWLVKTCRWGENTGLKNGQHLEIQGGCWGADEGTALQSLLLQRSSLLQEQGNDCS